MNRLLVTMLLSVLGFLCTGPVFRPGAIPRRSALGRLQFLPQPMDPSERPAPQYLSIPALFSLYGTTYGGDGVRTFGIPNLQGRAPVGVSAQEPIGAVFGNSTVTLTTSNLPPHRPQLFGSSASGGTGSPAGAMFATLPGNDYAAAGSPADKPMSPNAIGSIGSGIPISTQSPSLAMTWCVAVQGIFPSRP